MSDDTDYLRLATHAQYEADRATDSRTRAQWRRKATHCLRQLGRSTAPQPQSQKPEPAANDDESRDRPRNDKAKS